MSSDGPSGSNRCVKMSSALLVSLRGGERQLHVPVGDAIIIFTLHLLKVANPQDGNSIALCASRGRNMANLLRSSQHAS